jgi:hypothetical protein
MTIQEKNTRLVAGYQTLSPEGRDALERIVQSLAEAPGTMAAGTRRLAACETSSAFPASMPHGAEPGKCCGLPEMPNDTHEI